MDKRDRVTLWVVLGSAVAIIAVGSAGSPAGHAPPAAVPSTSVTSHATVRPRVVRAKAAPVVKPKLTPTQKWFRQFVENFNQQADLMGVGAAGHTSYTDVAMFGAAVAVCHDMQAGDSEQHMANDASAAMGEQVPVLAVQAMEASMPNGCPA